MEANTELRHSAFSRAELAVVPFELALKASSRASGQPFRQSKNKDERRKLRKGLMDGRRIIAAHVYIGGSVCVISWMYVCVLSVGVISARAEHSRPRITSGSQEIVSTLKLRMQMQMEEASLKTRR